MIDRFLNWLAVAGVIVAVAFMTASCAVPQPESNIEIARTIGQTGSGSQVQVLETPGACLYVTVYGVAAIAKPEKGC